jgi:hypothetical protein
MPLKRFSHLYTFAPSAASRPYWNRLTCFGIVQENSYNGPAIVDNVYFMTCKRWKRFDLPCLICVKIKLVEVDSSIQRRCLDGLCFLLRSAFPASSYARVLELPRTGRGRPRRDDGANDPRGARTLIEPERLMKPSLKRGSKKYAGAGARGEHKLFSHTRVMEVGEIRPLAVFLPSFHHDHLDHQEEKKARGKKFKKRGETV